MFYTADSYKDMERVGEPFNENGKLYTKVLGTCDRCGGTGIYACRVENNQIVPHPAYGGVCLKCGGEGKIEKVVRLYSENEYNRAQKAKEKRQAVAMERAAAREKERRAKAFTRWLERNGFDSEGNTYLISGNTYPIKDELKAQGYKFSKNLKWHGPALVEVPEDCFVDRIHWSDIFDWCEASGDMDFTEKGEEFLEKVFAAHSLGEFVGEVGERLRNLQVVFEVASSFEGYYGLTNVYKFDCDGAQLTWFTSATKDLREGAEYILTGTVKDHKVYGNTKTTYLNRCIVKEAN